MNVKCKKNQCAYSEGNDDMMMMMTVKIIKFVDILYRNVTLNEEFLGRFGKVNLDDFDRSRTCQTPDKIFQTQVTVFERPLMKNGVIIIINSVHTNE
jgi:hypothetical protein